VTLKSAKNDVSRGKKFWHCWFMQPHRRADYQRGFVIRDASIFGFYLNGWYRTCLRSSYMLSLLRKRPQLKIQKARYRAHKIPTTDTDTVRKQKFLHVPLLVSYLRTASPVIFSLMFSQKIFCMHCFVPPQLCFMLRLSSYFSDGHKSGTAGFSCNGLNQNARMSP
jgi:hypothetical protein